MFKLRDYQHDAVEAAVTFFESDTKRSAYMAITTGAGKSLICANIVNRLKGKTLVLQPSIEILEQNYKKFTSYGGRAGIYSASAGKRNVDRVVFAMIGSVINKAHLFKDFDNIIIDECHNCGTDGMYAEFRSKVPKAKVLGMTATPYRLKSGREGAMLEFIDRTNPRIFDDCIYYIQNEVLFDAGHLAALKYFSFDNIDRTKLALTSNGADFTMASMKAYFQQVDMAKITAKYTKIALSKCKNVLVFCATIDNAYKVQQYLPGSQVLTGETDDQERRQMLAGFKSGKFTTLINVGVLTTGFDFPELESVVIERCTMSLALYYQIIGRVMRPYTYPDGTKKIGYVIDLAGNIKMFGKIETMKIIETDKGLSIYQGARPLTNVPFTRN